MRLTDPFDIALEQAIVNRGIEIQNRERKALAAETGNNVAKALSG